MDYSNLVVEHRNGGSLVKAKVERRLRDKSKVSGSVTSHLAHVFGVTEREVTLRSNLLKLGSIRTEGMWEKIDLGELTLEKAFHIAVSGRSKTQSRGKVASRQSNSQQARPKPQPERLQLLQELRDLRLGSSQSLKVQIANVLRMVQDLVSLEQESSTRMSSALEQLQASKLFEPFDPTPPKEERLIPLHLKFREAFYNFMDKTNWFDYDYSKAGEVITKFFCAFDDDLRDLYSDLNRIKGTRKKMPDWLEGKSVPDQISWALNVLGLPVKPRPKWEDAHKKYRSLSLKYHPDRSRLPESETSFVTLNQAYHVLKEHYNK